MWTLVAAESQEKPPTSMIVLLIVLITGGVIYTFGYLRAVMHRANKDYKATKAAVPGLRKSFWKSVWAAIKVGVWVVIGVGILIAWTGRDLRDTTDREPVPAKVTPAVKRT